MKTGSLPGLGLFVALFGCASPPAETAVPDRGAGRRPEIADGRESGAHETLTPDEDLLIQDVCATPDGRLLPDDPYDPCPPGSARRDLRVGEALPYHRHDQPGPGAPLGYQRHDSFPRPGATRRYVHPFDFAPFGEYNPDHDGYDVVEADGAYASIIGTRDPVGLAQTFFGPGCALADSWLLYPTTGYATPGDKTAQLILVGWERALAPFPGRCPGRYDQSLTRWQLRAADFGGIGGSRSKHLDALVVDHYGGGAIATADHIERFYFTGLYGLTRWERWQRTGTPRAEGCSGPTSEGGFVRLDCRDWTHVVGDPSPYPPEAWPTPYAQSNLVQNHDFGGGTADHWERLGASTTGSITNRSVVTDGNGAHLATNCAGPCSPGQCIYQDVPRAALGGSFRFGGMFWAEGGSGSIEFVVFQRDARAAIVERHSVPLVVDGTPRRVVSPRFVVNPATNHFRITVYLNAPNTFHFDDLWLAASEP
jgi:hypothetical protein